MVAAAIVGTVVQQAARAAASIASITLKLSSMVPRIQDGPRGGNAEAAVEAPQAGET